MNSLHACRTAWFLGLLGLIPFVAPAVLGLIGNARWLPAQHAYAACILAFLGALHWGPALNGSAKKPAVLLAWGVMPSLFAWFTLQQVNGYTGAWLAAGLVVTLLVDIALAHLHNWPVFYIKLRCALTVFASVSLLLAYLK